MRIITILLPLAALAACNSQQPSGSSDPTTAPSDATASAVPPEAAAPSAPASSAAPSGTAPVLALEGLGDLKIGEAIPKGSSFAVRGVQASDTCLLASSDDFPGVYAIVEGGEVRRITVSRQGKVKLVEGIGVGSTENDVMAAFPGFVSARHTYVEPPAKYLTQPGNDPRLRFEIGADGKVTDIHVGERPQLLYVEGCA